MITLLGQPSLLHGPSCWLLRRAKNFCRQRVAAGPAVAPAFWVSGMGEYLVRVARPGHGFLARAVGGGGGWGGV